MLKVNNKNTRTDAAIRFLWLCKNVYLLSFPEDTSKVQNIQISRWNKVWIQVPMDILKSLKEKVPRKKSHMFASDELASTLLIRNVPLSKKSK